MDFQKYKDKIRCFQCNHLKSKKRGVAQIWHQCNLDCRRHHQWECYFIERTDECLKIENYNKYVYANECRNWETDINTKKSIYEHCKYFSPIKYKQLELF